VTRPQGIV